MESGGRGIIESTFTQNFYRAQKNPEAREAVYATLPMVLDGATDVFLWFLISNINELKTFKPQSSADTNKWVYADTALQVLTTLKPDQIVLAQRAATALGAVHFQKKDIFTDAGAVTAVDARPG